MSALDRLSLREFDQQTDISRQKTLSALEHVRFRQFSLYSKIYSEYLFVFLKATFMQIFRDIGQKMKKRQGFKDIFFKSFVKTLYFCLFIYLIFNSDSRPLNI